MLTPARAGSNPSGTDGGTGMEMVPSEGLEPTLYWGAPDFKSNAVRARARFRSRCLAAALLLSGGGGASADLFASDERTRCNKIQMYTARVEIMIPSQQRITIAQYLILHHFRTIA